MQVGGEVAQLFLHVLVATDQPVVTHHRGHCDREADCRHDERFTHGTSDLVDAGLTGYADRDEGVIDAPHRAEQADERSGGTHGRKPRQAARQHRVDAFDRTLQRHGHPLVQVDAIRETTFVVLRGTQTIFRDHAVGVALRQPVDRFANRRGRPELLLRNLGGSHELTLVQELHDDDVPRGQRHDHHDDQRALGDEIALLPQGPEAIRVIDDGGGGFCVFHFFLRE